MEASTSPRTTEPCPLQASPISCMPRDREFHIRDCSTPPYDGSTDDMSDKEANKPMLFRCLLLLLPVAIPVIVYLKDIDSMRRIFLTAFIMLLVIVLSCIMVALLRKRRRHLEGHACNGEVARELAHRHFMAMTHRFLPRTPLPLTHGRCRGDCEFNPEARRQPTHAYRSPYGRAPAHYHLTSTVSRSPSPQSNMLGTGPLPLLSLHFPRLEIARPENLSPRCDDPPSYEDAVLCPPDIPHQSHRQNPSPPETPPPPYETAVG